MEIINIKALIGKSVKEGVGNMETVWLKSVPVGEGRPKIAVPVTPGSREAFAEQLRRLGEAPFDIVEFRADYYRDGCAWERMLDDLTQLRQTVGNAPILFTLRTQEEGGCMNVAPEEYLCINRAAAQSGLVDAVDVEVFHFREIVREMIDLIHASGLAVVGSSHHFEGTPDEEKIVRALCDQQELGCDILKIAAMPHSVRDVITLLSATQRMYTYYANKPLVTMSMGRLGVVSRLCGQGFGSAITFGLVDKASAPGQIPAEKLMQVLEIVDQAMEQQ